MILFSDVFRHFTTTFCNFVVFFQAEPLVLGHWIHQWRHAGRASGHLRPVPPIHGHGRPKESEEKKFVVSVIRDLLKLCDLKKGKENKAAVASRLAGVILNLFELVNLGCRCITRFAAFWVVLFSTKLEGRGQSSALRQHHVCGRSISPIPQRLGSPQSCSFVASTPMQHQSAISVFPAAEAHWKFLKTVIFKLFEFMHETFPGVQQMAVDTFLRICQKCDLGGPKIQGGKKGWLGPR